MAATDSILALSQDELRDAKVGQEVNLKGKHNNRQCAKQSKQHAKNSAPNNDAMVSENALMNVIDMFAQKPGDNGQKGDIAEALLTALTGAECEDGSHKQKHKEDNKEKIKAKSDQKREATLRLLGNIKKCITGEQASILPEEEKEEITDEKRSKLISGRCAKPDDSDIKLVVKYTQ